MKDKKKLLFFAWTIVLLVGLIYYFLRALKIVEVSGKDRIRAASFDGGGLIIYRHPSLIEPVLMPLLLFPKVLFNVRLLPISLPDEKNYFKKKWFAPIRLVCVPVNRNSFGHNGVLEKVEAGLGERRVFAIAAGGGREKKGDAFKIIRDGKIIKVDLSGQQEFFRLSREVNGLIIRRFKAGVAHLLKKTKCPVLPVWVETTKFKIKIKVGDQFRLPEDFLRDSRRKEITEILEDSLLRLGER